MSESLDYSLFGDVLVKPASGETATPQEVLMNKVVSLKYQDSARHRNNDEQIGVLILLFLVSCSGPAIFWCPLVGT